MGREERKNTENRLAVLRSVQGHDNTVVHSFRHTEGLCPMCGHGEQLIMFCAPDEADMPKIRGCEIDGRHLHRLCGACKYPWVERTMDHAMLAQERGEAVVESELAAVLAVVAEHTGGIELDMALVGSRRGWILQFARDAEKRTVSVTSRPAPPQKPVTHPDYESVAGGGA